MAKFITLDVAGFTDGTTVATRVNVDYIVDYRQGNGAYTLVSIQRGERVEQTKVMMPVDVVDALIGL